jgi:predicted hydrocarbon binding protein
MLNKRRTDYFSRDFFDLDHRRGVLRSAGGTRLIAITETFLRGFVLALENETGPAAASVLRRCGEYFGQRLARRFEAEIGHYAEISIRDRSMAEFDALVRDLFAGCGFGQLLVSWELGRHGCLALDLEGSPMQDIGPSGHVRDDLFAGTLQGFFGTFCDATMRCVQTADYRRGDKRTRFVLVPEANVADIEAMLEQGSKHDDVVAYLSR